MTDFKSWPLIMIESQGLTYMSVTDMGETVRIQLHPNLVDRTKFINIDKRVLSDLIKALEKYEQW
jgi:hypothetical protein